MNKITIEGLNINNNEIIVDKFKFLFGFDINNKHLIRNYIKKYFDKDLKSEYEEEKNIKISLKYNDNWVDLKKTNFIDVFEFYDLKDDIKLGTKSLLLKYYDLYLENIEYNDAFISTMDCLKFLESDLNLEINLGNILVNGTLIDFNKKTLMKMIEAAIYKDGLEISPYALSYEEIIIFQIELLKKIAKFDKNKIYISIVDIPILSKNILFHIKHDIENLNFIIFSLMTNNNENIEEQAIAIIDDNIIDMINEEQLYEIAINCNKNISISELKKSLIEKYILSVKEVVGK